MRGSPLLRALVVLAALLVTGLGLARLTAGRTQAGSQTVVPVEQAQPTEEVGNTVPFELILSSSATEVSLDGGAEPFKKADTAEPVSGTLKLSGEHPLVSLQVKWSDASPGHRFALLRLEIPGKDTLEHVFNAPGDIDDIWEPLP